MGNLLQNQLCATDGQFNFFALCGTNYNIYKLNVERQAFLLRDGFYLLA